MFWALLLAGFALVALQNVLPRELLVAGAAALLSIAFLMATA